MTDLLTDPQKEIGSLLNVARNQTERTKKTISKAIGVSEKTIAKWESGASLPPLERCNVIASAYTLDVRKFSQVLEEAWTLHQKQKSNRKNATKIVKKKKVEESLFTGEIETSSRRRRDNFLGGYDNTHHAKH